MNDFVFVAKTSDIAENEMRLYEVDDQLVLVAHVGGDFFCIDDVCTHDGGTLGDGELCGHEIACPRHGAKFDIRSGEATKMPATQATGCHEVNVDNDQIFVRLSND